MRTVAAAASLACLAGCASLPASDTPAPEEMLRSSLRIAAAALAAGQLDVARRLYLPLAERFEDAPEPHLGLGYIALQDGDLAAANRHFLRAAKRAPEASATKAEALLGAGRMALARGRMREAGRHFLNARESGEDTPSAAWIANGLAITATLEADYETAEARYTEALRLSSGHPRITANFVRMLIAAGRIDDAARMHARHDSAYWADDDDRVFSRLLRESHQWLRLPGRGSGTPRSSEGRLE